MFPPLFPPLCCGFQNLKKNDKDTALFILSKYIFLNAPFVIQSVSEDIQKFLASRITLGQNLCLYV